MGSLGRLFWFVVVSIGISLSARSSGSSPCSSILLLSPKSVDAGYILKILGSDPAMTYLAMGDKESDVLLVQLIQMKKKDTDDLVAHMNRVNDLLNAAGVETTFVGFLSEKQLRPKLRPTFEAEQFDKTQFNLAIVFKHYKAAWNSENGASESVREWTDGKMDGILKRITEIEEVFQKNNLYTAELEFYLMQDGTVYVYGFDKIEVGTSRKKKVDFSAQREAVKKAWRDQVGKR